MKFLSIVFGCAVFLSFSVSQVHAAVCEPGQNLDGKTDAELQAISDACDRELAAQQVILAQNHAEQATVKSVIDTFTASINKSQSLINTKNAQIKQLGQNINEKTRYISELEARSAELRKSIGKIIRDSYAADDATVLDVLLSSKNVSLFFLNNDNYAILNDRLQETIAELTGVKRLSETERGELEKRKAQEEQLKFEEEKTKALTESYRKERQRILDAIKGDETKLRADIAEKERIKNQIRNRLFRTASGMEISFGDALKLIQPYESRVGVNAALILAVLFQESSSNGNIGSNIGRCTYNQTNPCGVAGKFVMSDTQIPAYTELMNTLGLNMNTSPVSCPICRDGNYGGAMGPAQFMPQTWSGIAKRVASILGISYPSPFENLHAFTAAGVLLKDNMDRCRTAFTSKSDLWSCSASKYYGGLNLAGSRLTNFMYYGYGKSVLNRALQFEKDIATLAL